MNSDNLELCEFVVGKCKTMCPKEEMKIRENAGLLHILEMKPGTEKTNKPKADPKRIVKAFNRSAAGTSMTDVLKLRPPDVLLKTLSYLLEDVIQDSNASWAVKYSFIMDRLRSIRQDMIIQNISRAYSISILQPIVRFYAYSSYKLCDQEVNVFDPYLNNRHLQECLNRLLVIYDDTEAMLQSTNTEINHLEFIKESRPFFEALYVILNLGNEIALHRVLKLSKIWRTPLLTIAISISLSYLKCNFVRVCKHMKHLPPLLLAISVLHLPEIRRKTFQTMSVAYNSKNLTFPLKSLKYLLMYDTEDDVIQDCRNFSLELIENSVRFDKSCFKIQSNKVPKKKPQFVEEKLRSIDESYMLLFNLDIP